jgi:hypothetical protein
MRRVRDIGPLAKVSHWIASDVGWLIAVAARGGRTSLLLDTEARLALGLEPYGEILCVGDTARIDGALRELEAGPFALVRPKTPFEYSDPLERPETRRRMGRRARRLRKQVERMTAARAGGRALRDAKQELAVLEGADQWRRARWRPGECRAPLTENRDRSSSFFRGPALNAVLLSGRLVIFIRPD